MNSPGNKSDWLDPSCVRTLVSVIIPTFNRSAVISEAIGSIIAQQYRPIELIIVDDGSTDETAGIIEKIRDTCADDESMHLQYIRQENAGAAVARNHGLRQCRGEFIQFLDSDDLLEPEKLARQVAMLDEEPECDVVYGDWLMGADRESARLLTRSPESDMLIALLRGRWVPCFSYLWRRRAVLATGPWNEQLIVNDDFDYSARAAANGTRFLYSPGLTGLYRWHAADRLSRQSVCNFAQANYQVLREVARTLNDRRQLSDDRRRAIADCYWSQAAPSVNIDRRLFETGMRELRSICPNWQIRQYRYHLAMRLLGEVRAAQFGLGVSGIRSMLRQGTRRFLGDRLRRWIIQVQNRLITRREIAQ